MLARNIEANRSQYEIYLDGLCKDTRPKEWMKSAMVLMLKMAFAELEERPDIETMQIVHKWFERYYSERL